MEYLEATIDSESLSGIFSLPQSLRHRKVEVIIRPAGEGKPEAVNPAGAREGEAVILTKQMIDEILQSPLLQSLTGLLHTDMSPDEIRSARLQRYERID
jgi:hypothetical protein